MTTYCFDTDILAAALLRDPPMQLVRRLARTTGDEQCTTAVSVAELLYAAARTGDDEVAGRVREVIAAATAVLPFDHEAAEAYGSLRAHLESIGVRLDEPSLRIAAIVVSHDLTLVTGSGRLYDRVPGLRIENWLEPDGLEVALENEDADVRDALALRQGNGTVRHPGVVPALEARVRAVSERAARELEDTSQLEG